MQPAERLGSETCSKQGVRETDRRIRLLTFSTLFPSCARPRHGIFVETRLRHLVSTGCVQAEVVAPVPWFPFRGSRFGVYGAIARTPSVEARSGLHVQHPRYLVIPKIGMMLQPLSLARSARRSIERRIRSGFNFDIIDAHYFYPDGVAASHLAAYFKRPFVITARGTDINVIAHLDGPKRLILAAAQRADAVIAVSNALASDMASLGVDSRRIVVIRNGVDCNIFKPLDRIASRQQLRLTSRRIVVAVGNLVPEKGHELIVRCLPQLSDSELLIIGDGAERDRLVALARRLGVEQRLHFLAPVPQAGLSAIYSAADVLVLSSVREGWPNVVLESMACGTPVVATDVGSVREIITGAHLGEVVPVRSSAHIQTAVQRIFDFPPDRSLIRRHAEQFGWEAVSRAQLDLFERLSARSQA